MEWLLPIQKLTVGNISMSAPGARQQKPLAALSYNDGSTYCHPTLSILLPPLSILSYDPASGRLVLDTTPNHLLSLKLQMLQDMILEAIQYNQSSWFSTSYRIDEIRAGFQSLFESNSIVLHCPTQGGSGNESQRIPFFKEGKWTGVKGEWLAPKTKIRIAVKIQGISFLMREQNAWSSRSRVQHRILGIILQENS